MQSQLTARVQHRASARTLHRAKLQQSPVVARVGLFKFLAPKPAEAPVNNQRAQELVEELVDICKVTDAGAKASPARREEIAELVDELQQYCMKNPLKSQLLWGEYEVLYASKATAVGGPLKSGAGPVFFPGQVARQILEEPNSLVNQVQFKTLGFIGGYSRQYGTINPISGDTFILEIERGELSTGVGGVQQREFDIQRRIQIAYLDDTLRVARFLPSEELADDEAGEQRSEEEIIFVFKRVVEEEEEEEAVQVEEEEEEEEPVRKPRGTISLFAPRTQAGVATMAERDARAKMQQEAGSRAGTTMRGGRRGRQQEVEEEEDPRAARAARQQQEREERIRAAEEEKERRRQEAEERAEALRVQKEREAAAKEEQRERQAAIKELLATLQQELREKQAEAKEAAKEVADLRRAQMPVLKQVEAARAAVEEAEEQTQAAAAELVEVTGEHKQAEVVLKQAQAELREAEKELKKNLLVVKK